MPDLLKKITNKEVTRRDFLKISACTAAALASMNGCGKLDMAAGAANSAGESGGEWISAACWHNCGGRCVNKVLVVDGVVVRQKTDDSHPDSPDYPQQRGCLRGRSQRKLVFGADRLKYPMKRKHWEPLTGGDKSLRGRDEWERISWEEALDYVAAELKNAKEKYGNRSILSNNPGPFVIGSDITKVLNPFGGYTEISDTASFGTFAYVSGVIGTPFYGVGGSNDRYDLHNSETIVLYGNNPAWSSLGSPSYQYWQAKKAGAKFVYVGPSYNATADLLDAKWIRVRPGTDTAFLMAVAYVMLTEDDPVTNPIIDWAFLNRCTVGFDSEHMPKDAELQENFRDYILGKYDNQPKTSQWAFEICGTPVEDILWFAREMRKDNKVALLHGWAPARCNNAEDFPQIFMTVGAMGGHMGKPGHACGAGVATKSGNVGPDLVMAGASGAPVFTNPVEDTIAAPEVWNAVLDGRYNLAASYNRPGSTSKGMRDIDIHVIFHATRNSLQTTVGANRGIEAHRKVDFVAATAFSLTACAQYADIVLPVTTEWERPGCVLTGNREMLIFTRNVIAPMYEAKSDQWIHQELVSRLGVDAAAVFPLSEEQQFYNKVTGAMVINEAGNGYEPLVAVTENDLAEWRAKWGEVEGRTQQGRIGLMELLERGVYQVERRQGDPYGHINYKAFVEDPENNPLASTPSGKFEIYCQSKANRINSMGRSTLKPYPTYIPALNGYEQSFSDWGGKVKGDYPYQITNPHYPRRSHTTFDNVPWLREALPNPVFLNARDAAEKGVKDGDTVLIWNQHGKVLRQASLSERLMPGYMELPHGTWMSIDEKTGIDSSGSDNVLCAQAGSGCGVSGYNTQLVNFEKYAGAPLEDDCVKPLNIVNI